jgi:hypothetical protein
MKRDTFVAGGLRIETARDWDGRWFIAWKPHVSQYFRDPKVMLRWVAWPVKTPTGDSLRSWIASLTAADAERANRKAAEPARDELLATGFGPECHLDESDPNHNTRTII